MIHRPISSTDPLEHEWFTTPADVGQSTAHQRFGHPAFREPFGRIHWASTETAVESAGHIDGALEAAEHVVQHLLATTNTTTGPP